MSKTLKEIARLVGGEIAGNADILIKGVCGIKEAESGELTFLANPKYLPYLDKTAASAVIVGKDIQSSAKPLIRVDNPSLAFIKAAALFTKSDLGHPRGIHSTALIAKNAKLGKNVAIGSFVTIEEGVNLGDNTIVYSNSFIGKNTRIGRDCLIYPSVSIREDISIGDRVIIHNGAVIGSEGFGYVTVEGSHRHIPQTGTVVLEDDVEIGANTTIDRARFDKTVVGKGTKIDNLVHIAHNVIIGENSLIVAQAGVSGSTIIGNNVILAGQAGLVGHITIGDNAIVGAQGGVTKSVPANTFVSGYPARPHEAAMRVNACLQNLPKLFETVKELKKKIEELEKK